MNWKNKQIIDNITTNGKFYRWGVHTGYKYYIAKIIQPA